MGEIWGLIKSLFLTKCPSEQLENFFSLVQRVVEYIEVFCCCHFSSSFVVLFIICFLLFLCVFCCIIQALLAFLQLSGTPWSKGKQICPYQPLTPWRNTSLERESEQEGSRTSPSLFLAKQAGVHRAAVPFGSKSEALLSPCHTFHGNFCSTAGSEAWPLGQQHLSIALPICSPHSSALYMHLEGTSGRLLMPDLSTCLRTGYIAFFFAARLYYQHRSKCECFSFGFLLHHIHQS